MLSLQPLLLFFVESAVSTAFWADFSRAYVILGFFHWHGLKAVLALERSLRALFLVLLKVDRIDLKLAFAIRALLEVVLTVCPVDLEVVSIGGAVGTAGKVWTEFSWGAEFAYPEVMLSVQPHLCFAALEKVALKAQHLKLLSKSSEVFVKLVQQFRAPALLLVLIADEYFLLLFFSTGDAHDRVRRNVLANHAAKMLD